jgi:hypothetical protein
VVRVVGVGADMPITSKQLAAHILKILDDVVKEYPEDEREEAKVAILNAYSGQMFSMPMRMGEDA